MAEVDEDTEPTRAHDHKHKYERTYKNQGPASYLYFKCVHCQGVGLVFTDDLREFLTDPKATMPMWHGPIYLRRTTTE